MAKRHSRLVIVSARGPFVNTATGPRRAPGGLVSALLPLMRHTRGTWLATGADRDAAEVNELAFRVRALCLPQETRSLWYSGASNGALWPLAHGFLDRCHFRAEEARAYQDVNRAVAQCASELAPQSGVVWIHDYQLALVPALLRARRPDLTIGFFWHIPWPASENFRVLPWAHELIQGLLGAHVVGVHVPRYVQAIGDCLRELGVRHEVSDAGIIVRVGEHATLFSAMPIGVDVERWAALGRDEDVMREASRLRSELRASRVLLAVDRMDYAKGIVERLEAFERVLERSGDACDRVCLIQVGVPTRESVPAYRELRQRIEATIGRIEGRFGKPARKPVHLLCRSYEAHELAALYVAADAAIVTPLRDGMNLVAHEYVASRPGPSGRLVLSTTAGAADVLPDAHLVNPYDEDGLSAAIAEAALAPETIADSVRMSKLKAKVASLSIDVWASNFLAKLEGASTGAEGAQARGQARAVRAR